MTDIEVVHYTYLLGREYEYVQEPMLQAMQMSPTPGSSDVSFTDFDVNKVRESTHRLVEKLVVSIGGKSGNCVESFLDLPQEDYEHILSVLNDVTGGKKKSDLSKTTK